MGGALTASIKGGLRKSAQDILIHTDDVKKTAKIADEAKQIDEVIEHLEDVADISKLKTESVKCNCCRKLLSNKLNDRRLQQTLCMHTPNTYIAYVHTLYVQMDETCCGLPKVASTSARTFICQPLNKLKPSVDGTSF